MTLQRDASAATRSANETAGLVVNAVRAQHVV
jgi:hypothetical protein